MKRRGQLVQSEVVWTIIAIAVLILSFIIFFLLKGKGSGAWEYIKDLLRFGR